MPSIRRAPTSVVVHAVVVALSVGLFVVMAVAGADGVGANIGAGIALLPVLGLGAPWTIPMIMDPDAVAAWPKPLWYLAALGPAVLNVALHAGVLGRLRRHTA